MKILTISTLIISSFFMYTHADDVFENTEIAKATFGALMIFPVDRQSREMWSY